MTPTVNDWTIAVVGSWNLAILTPEWVAANVFQTETVDVELMIVGARHELRFRSGLVQLTPQATQVYAAVGESSAEALLASERAVCNLLEQLPRTPMTGIGVNFGFADSDDAGELAPLFVSGDDNYFADNAYPVSSISHNRAIGLQEGRVLNLRRTLRDGRVHFHFNFHKDIQNAQEARMAIEGRSDGFRQLALTMLQDSYNIRSDNAGGVANG